jgi:hypothetical protein|tara:strand:+ start:481 stop:831 length:351 start_codon:yes stop_codon:yes gene_type:complete
MGGIQTEMRRRRRKRSAYSLLKDYKSTQWRNALSSISNEYLKIKIACIVYWDFYDEENKKCPVYLKKLVQSYDKIDPDVFHAMFEEYEVVEALLDIGYTTRLSKRRSYQQEDKNDY